MNVSTSDVNAIGLSAAAIDSGNAAVEPAGEAGPKVTDGSMIQLLNGLPTAPTTSTAITDTPNDASISQRPKFPWDLDHHPTPQYAGLCKKIHGLRNLYQTPYGQLVVLEIGKARRTTSDTGGMATVYWFEKVESSSNSNTDRTTEASAA